MSEIKPIRTESDYQAALHEIGLLFAAPPGTAEGDRLEVLAILVDAYEAKNHVAPAADPLDVLRLTMEGQERSQADLAEVLGSRSRASELLSRRRALSSDMVDKLSRAWAIPPEALRGPAAAGGGPGFATRLALAGLVLLFLAGASVGTTLWHYGRDLPHVEQIALYRPSEGTYLDAEGHVTIRRQYVPLSEIPPHVVKAFLAAEDKDFYAHEGTSGVAILRAAVRNLQDPRDAPRGGSTITQQLAKNVLLSGEPRSLERKIKEIILARQIERHLPKDWILELYLNQIYFGGDAYGVQVAAQTYFGKSVAELTVAEAAVLAALPKAPNLYRIDLAENLARAKSRRDWVLGRMAEDGLITASAAHLAAAEPLRTMN